MPSQVPAPATGLHSVSGGPAWLIHWLRIHCVDVQGYGGVKFFSGKKDKTDFDEQSLAPRSTACCVI